MSDTRTPIQRMIDEACGFKGDPMSSNLPPGCNSPDGGIDHAFESALESLCMDIQTADEAHALRAMLPALRDHLQNAYDAGTAEGRMLAQQEADFKARKTTLPNGDQGR